MSANQSADVMYQAAPSDSFSMMAEKSPFPLDSVLEKAESEVGIGEQPELPKEE